MNRRPLDPVKRSCRAEPHPDVLCCVIRISTDYLELGSLPTYDFDAPAKVFYLDADGANILSLDVKNRITVPEFEIGVFHRDMEEAKTLLKLKIANKLAMLCMAMDVTAGVAVVPSRGIVVLRTDREFNAYVQIGMLLVPSWRPNEEDRLCCSADLDLPRFVPDVAEMERQTASMLSMYEVMDS